MSLVIGESSLVESVTYERHSASFLVSDRLFFPPLLKYISVSDKVIVLSPETANWLILDNEEIEILKYLIAGKSIGDVASWARNNSFFEKLKSLLSQIMARRFASKNEQMIPLIDNSLKGAYFYLTNACNLQCSHCYMFSGSAANDELSINEWLLLIDDFSSLGGKAITFSGGEVLAKRGWFQLIEHAYAKGISSTILTNGTMWTETSIQKVAPFVAEIQISIDGPTEEVNSRTRGTGFFLKAIETAKSFAAVGVRTSIAMTPTIDTINLFEEHFKDFFNKYISGNKINVKISHKLLLGRDGVVLSDDEKIEYESVARRLANMIYPTSALRSFYLGHQPNVIQENCGFGGLSISSTGDIYPCNRIADVGVCGNVRTIKLAEIIPRLAELEKVTNVDNIIPCRNCDLRYICGGGCRIDDFYISGKHGESSVFRELSSIDNGEVIKEICTNEHKLAILKKMIAVKDYMLLANDET